MLEAPLTHGGCGLNIAKLERTGSIKALFPLPDARQRDELATKW